MSGEAASRTKHGASIETVIHTSFSHRGLALVGTALVLFEVLFVTLLALSFWFSLNLALWGIPTVVVFSYVANALLSLLEGPAVCRLLRFVLNGKPLLIYRRWLSCDERGFTFGIKRVDWDAVDAVSLNFFSTLLIKSRKLCGPPNIVGNEDLNPADTILKMPFGAIDLESQRHFVETLNKYRAGIAFNDRLKKQISQPGLKGLPYLQASSVLILALALIDLGYATFTYLETLKQYYLCRVVASQSDMASANEHFARAEDLRQHPLPVSWVAHKLTSLGGVSEIYERARSDALWALGQRQEALRVAKEAAERSGIGFRLHLRVARLSSLLGNDVEANTEIQKAIDQRDDALLPRLYLSALFLGNGKLGAAQKSFKEYTLKLDNEVFGKEPPWPPGGDRFLTDVWYKDDLDFVFGRIIGEKNH
jgi:tetratricopeptide (TPR) repeat protein